MITRIREDGLSRSTWRGFGLTLHSLGKLEDTMPRQSIPFAPRNDDWLKAQSESEEYTSKSAVVNALIRKARENEAIRSRSLRLQA